MKIKGHEVMYGVVLVTDNSEEHFHSFRVHRYDVYHAQFNHNKRERWCLHVFFLSLPLAWLQGCIIYLPHQSHSETMWLQQIFVYTYMRSWIPRLTNSATFTLQCTMNKHNPFKNLAIWVLWIICTGQWKCESTNFSYKTQAAKGYDLKDHMR